MLDQLGWLGLEAKALDRTVAFYETALGLDIVESTDREARFAAGPTELRVRRPRSVPRGGVHTHYAFSIPPAEYGGWVDRLSAEYDLSEHDFGGAKSLYLYDPDGNCVELGQQPVDGPGIDGVFEVVLEVRELDRAADCYRALGFDVVDEGANRRRVRLGGPMALELWEPHLGIADARGGLHVDLGFGTPSPENAAAAIEDWTCSRERTEEGIRVVEEDGHVLTFYKTQN